MSWKSRKLWLVIGTKVTITAIFVAMGMPKDLFATFGGLLLGAAGIFTSGNVAQKFAKPKEWAE